MSLVPLVGLAHVEQLDLVVCEQSLELVERDRLELLRAAAFLPARDPEQRDRVQRRVRRAGLVLVGRVEDERTVGQDERRLRGEARSRDGDADRARMVARRERVGRADVEDDRVLRHRARAPERRLSTEQRTAVQLDDPLHVRRPRRLRAERGAEEVGELAPSAGLKRRSKPIVVDAFELIAAPQSEPAT